METKKIYMAPDVKVVAFKAENGFAGSLKITSHEMDMEIFGNQEEWYTDDHTFNNEGFSWQ